MIKVWVLLAYFASYNGSGGMGGPVVVDDIVSKSECERVARNYITVEHYDFRYTCVEVWKAK